MSAGPFAEILADAQADVRRRAEGWRGTRPVRLVNIEQVQVMGGGMQALVTFQGLDCDERFAVTLSPEDARAAARMLSPIGEHAESGIFVVQSGGT